jgi:hypothetical protein
MHWARRYLLRICESKDHSLEKECYERGQRQRLEAYRAHRAEEKAGAKGEGEGGSSSKDEA